MTAGLIRCFLASLLLALASAQVTASELVTQRAYLEDPRGDLAFEQVKLAPFVNAGRVISKGYLSGALWVRLTVQAPDEARVLVLQLFPDVLEDVTIFSLSHPSATRIDPTRESKRFLGKQTLLVVTPGENRFYLRVKTPGVMLVFANILTEDQAQQEDIKRGIALGAVLACCIPIMAWVSVLIVKRREPLHTLFLLNFILSVGLYFGWYGYLKELFAPQSWFGSGTFISYLLLIKICIGFLFVKILLDRFGLPLWGKYIFKLFFALYLPLFLLYFLMDKQLVLRFSTLLGAGISVFCLVLTVAVFRLQKSSTWLIATVLFVAISFLLRSFLTMQGALAPDQGNCIYPRA